MRRLVFLTQSVDPAHPDNRGIADIALAPRDPTGLRRRHRSRREEGQVDEVSAVERRRLDRPTIDQVAGGEGCAISDRCARRVR